MNLLLDTHVILWAAFDPRRLPAEARGLIADPAHTLWFSVASIWEVAVKTALKRPSFSVDASVLRAGLLASGYRELPVEGRHVIALATLPAHHADPFDRMLIVQAAAEGMVLLTADAALEPYGGPVRVV